MSVRLSWRQVGWSEAPVFFFRNETETAMNEWWLMVAEQLVKVNRIIAPRGKKCSNRFFVWKYHHCLLRWYFTVSTYHRGPSRVSPFNWPDWLRGKMALIIYTNFAYFQRHKSQIPGTETNVRSNTPWVFHNKYHYDEIECSRVCELHWNGWSV